MLKPLQSKSSPFILCASANLTRYHEKVQRHVERQNRDLPPSRIPAQVLLGKQAKKAATPGLQIRGPANDVEKLNAMILAFLEQEEKDELERGFTTSFEYPHKLASHLIGTKGANIKKLQEEFDVEINYTENKVDLKGPKAKCEAAKSHILSSAKKLEDEATHQIKIPQQYHYELKGSKGSQVIRLQERYNVRINFPRQAQAPIDDADAATEASFKNHPSQAPDIVIVKGPRKGADEAREELLNLLQYVVDNSNSATVTVAAKQIPSLIGAGGRELDALRNETKCRIDMPKKEDVEGNDRVEIRLRGTKKQVEEAKKLLLEKAKSFDNTVSESLEVDQKFYKTIIGPSGATLSKIVLDAGGPEDRRLANRYVTFPKQGSSETGIQLQGSKPVVEKIKKAILALVSEKEGQTTEIIEIPQEMHRHLIGPGGSIRRKMEEDFNVEINVPRTETSGPERSRVKITGKPEDIAKANAHISSVLKRQASEIIEVPLRFHHIIAEDGNIFRKLRNEHGISVDHAGKKPPQKDAAAGASRGRVAEGGALPLITDDSSATSHSWEVVEPQSASSGQEGNIPWVLRGNADNMAKARKIIEQKLANASKPLTTGYLILPDPRLNRFVIGPNGSTINNIRQQTGVQIQVPKQGSGSEAIEIKGPKDGVEEAKELILEAIEQGANGGGQRRN
jgi:predicted PilT family ATPase